MGSTSNQSADIEISENGDITYKQGFTAIKCSIFENRKAMDDSGKDIEPTHIFNVREVHKSGKPPVITGRSLRHLKIRGDPYFLHLELGDERQVAVARCSCQSGADGVCKHIAALVHFVNRERPLSKTDLRQEWHAPSAYSKKVFPKGKPLFELTCCGK